MISKPVNIYLAGKVNSLFVEWIKHAFENDNRLIFHSSAWSPLDVTCGQCGFNFSLMQSDWRGKYTIELEICERCGESIGCSHCGSEHVQHGRCVMCDGSNAMPWYFRTATKLIKGSKALIAAIDTLDAFGTIAEIGYAYGQGIPCYGLIDNDELDYDWTSSHPMDFVSSMFKRVEYGKDCFPKFIKETVDEITGRPRAEDLSKCQSPIEKSFLEACYKAQLKPECQHPIGHFLADFAFPESRLVIELDGHEFHKTKEQRTSDARRQRWIELNGWRVIRFTGTEIHKDVSGCVKQVSEFLNMLNCAG